MRRLISTAYSEHSAESYDIKRFRRPSGKLFAQLEQEILSKAISKISLNSSVLEVGAGTGRFSLHLAKQGYRINLIDLSRPMLRICKDKFCEQKLGFSAYHCSSTHLPFRSCSFDFVFAIRLLNQLPFIEAALQTIREMLRVCKTGGYVLFEFVNRDSLSRIGACARETTFLSMRILLQDLGNLTSEFSVESKWGILFFSQSVLEKIPTMELKEIFLGVDNFFSSVAPLHTTRCYIMLNKIATPKLKNQK